MKEIWELWQSCVVNPDKQASLERIALTIVSNLKNYRLVAQATNIPAIIVGCLHYRESDFDFTTHLANGDPLFNSDGIAVPTVNEPRGLGPFHSWVSGAIGALKYEGFTHGYHWDIVNALDNCERYNGLGYREMNVLSPYVWAGTNHYEKGKYTADGQYDPNFVDEQLGCAAILLSLKQIGLDLSLKEIEP